MFHCITSHIIGVGRALEKNDEKSVLHGTKGWEPLHHTYTLLSTERFYFSISVTFLGSFYFALFEC